MKTLVFRNHRDKVLIDLGGTGICIGAIQGICQYVLCKQVPAVGFIEIFVFLLKLKWINRR